MKIRALTPMALLAIFAITHSHARIIIDDSAPEPAPEKPGIQLQRPEDAGGGESATRSGPVQDTLSFLNKDQLHGILLAIDDAGLHWQSPEARDLIIFKIAQVSQIKLESHKAAAAGRFAERVGLTNGDEFPGNILSLDSRTLVLETSYAGRLSIPRAMLRYITPVSDANSSIYQGPTSIDGWIQGRLGGGHNWFFCDGALIGSNYGTIGRDMKLPGVSSIAFDVVLRGNCQLNVAFYTDRPDNFGNCYMLTLSNGYTQLQRYSRGSGSSDLGSVPLPNILRRTQSHIDIRINKEKKSIWLMIDGKTVKEWTDSSEFNGDGGSVLSPASPVPTLGYQTSRCQNGTANLLTLQCNPKIPGEDCVQLANEDKVTGHLESIQDGKAKLVSAYAELNIPMERIEEISLLTGHSEQAKLTASDVRAYFPEGGRVTMQLMQWDAKKCTGSSLNFGTATFSPDAFARILFNLPAQQNQDSDDSGIDNDRADQETQ